MNNARPESHVFVHLSIGDHINPVDIANVYYDAWKNKSGDMSEVPLAEDLVYRGPVASFDEAAGFRQMPRRRERSSRASKCASSSPTATKS